MVDLPRSDVPGRTADQASETRAGAPAAGAYPTWTEDTLSGWGVFTGFVFGLVGVFQVIFGIVALAKASYFTAPPRALAVHASYTTWGWTHLILGLTMLAAGIGLAFGVTWARIVGVVLAGLSVIANVAFMPAAPFAATLFIALDVFLIYAITVHGAPKPR